MDVEKQVRDTIKKYSLINKEDKVVVALSGGKDSTSALYILHKLRYNVSGLMIDINLGEWSKTHRDNMQRFCDNLGVDFHLVDLKKELGHGIGSIKTILKKEKNLTGCTVCGVIKRWILNKWAKKLGADVIVTGHNLDDECQTVLMNFLKGNIFLGINSTPSTGEKDQEGFVQRVKPFFFIPESEIKKYALKNKFKILYDRCPCAVGTYRVETRDWLKNLSNNEKLRVVSAWQNLIPSLKKNHLASIRKCKICKEPSRGEICKACSIFETLKK